MGRQEEEERNEQVRNLLGIGKRTKAKTLLSGKHDFSKNLLYYELSINRIAEIVKATQSPLNTK